MTVETASPKKHIDKYDNFVQHVMKICREQPGRRSALRRGVGRTPEQSYGTHAIVSPWFDGADSSRRYDAINPEEYALYSVAGMIAAQTRSGRDPLGDETEDLETDPEHGAEPGEATSETGNGTRAVRRRTLGTALGLAVGKEHQARRAIGEETAEKRLHLLVRQDLHGVHRHLPRVVRHIGLLDVPIDWAQLIDDLRRWTPNGQRFVAKAWLQDFYRTLHTNPTEEKP